MIEYISNLTKKYTLANSNQYFHHRVPCLYTYYKLCTNIYNKWLSLKCHCSGYLFSTYICSTYCTKYSITYIEFGFFLRTGGSYWLFYLISSVFSGYWDFLSNTGAPIQCMLTWRLINKIDFDLLSRKHVNGWIFHDFRLFFRDVSNNKLEAF